MEPLIPDRFDWRGCAAVHFNPEKMGGTGTVGEVRLSADSVYENYLDGMSVEEIGDCYSADLQDLHTVVDFAVAHDLQPRSMKLLLIGMIWLGDEQLVFKIIDLQNGVRMDMRRRDSFQSKSTGAGLWPDVEKAKSIAQEITVSLFGPNSQIDWTNHSD